jgi:lactoylglutathione lyase
LPLGKLFFSLSRSLFMRLVALFVSLVSLVSTHVAQGQSASFVTPTFNHAAVCVRDLKRSTDFYRTALGLQEVPNPFNDGLHTWFKIGPALQLHVIQRGCTVVTSKDNHLCLSVPVLSAFTDHLDKLNLAYTNLKGDGKTPTARIDGVKQIYLQDPDGYWIEINDAK